MSRRLPWVEPGDPLPPVDQAMREPNGLLAAGRDLSAARLLEAYRNGIFPWYVPGQPILWWSPDPRMVLYLDDFRASASLLKLARKVAREGLWAIRFNTAFDAVMQACAQPRPGQDGTWISADIRAAYGELHMMGHAHCVEVWRPARDGSSDALIGGLYGVSMGRMFFGESMFTRERDASKLALLSLVNLLRQLDFRVIDCQQNTRHLASLGAREIPRSSFVTQLSELAQLPDPDWSSVRIEVSGA
ncbi:MAG: hypothetical protein RI906_1256 [Pseudomonadota bacterium]